MKPRSQGFTLVELLIALMIFSILGFTVTSRIGEIVQQSFSLERRTAAQWVADNQVNALLMQSRSAREPVSEGRRSERVLLARRDWQIDYQVVGTTDPSLKRVELEVFELLDDGTKYGPVHNAIAFVGQH